MHTATGIAERALVEEPEPYLTVADWWTGRRPTLSFPASSPSVARRLSDNEEPGTDDHQ